MADINVPAVGDISALNTAVAELEARLKQVQASELQTIDAMEEIVIQEGNANTANLRRQGPQGNVTEQVLAELSARQRVTTAINEQAAALERLAAAAKQVSVTSVSSVAGVAGLSETEIAAIAAATGAGTASSGSGINLAAAAPAVSLDAEEVRQATRIRDAKGRFTSQTSNELSAAVAAGGAASGGGGGRRPTANAAGGGGEGEDVKLNASSAQLGQRWQQTNAQLVALDNTMTKHGYLTSEVIAAAQRGELTYAEWGEQIAGTAAKFGAWTAVSIPIFAAIDGFKKLYDGAIQTSQGIAFIERSINNLNTGQARTQIQSLSQQFNVPISDATQAMGVMARQFHNQNQAAQAAQAPLYAEKLGDLDINTAAQRFTGIAKSFQLPASDLVSIYDQVAQAQRRFGVTADQSTTALATAGGVWHTAGGSLSQLLALTTALNRVTGGGATGANIATMISYANSQLTNNANAQGRARALGIDPTKGIVSVFDQMIEKAKQDPANINAIAGIFGARGARYLPALLANTDFYKQVQQQTSPQASQGVANFELTKMLSGAQEQIKKIGVELENIGSSLEQSGFVTGLGVAVSLLDHMLIAVNGLVNAFNAIPDPFRTIAASILEGVVALRVIRSTSLGPVIANNAPVSWLPAGLRSKATGLLREDPKEAEAKAIQTQARNDLNARVAESNAATRSAGASVAVAQRASIQAEQAERAGADPATVAALRLRANALNTTAVSAEDTAVIAREVQAAYAQVYENVRLAENATAKLTAAEQGGVGSYALPPYTKAGGEVGYLGGAGEPANPNGTPVDFVAAGGSRAPNEGGFLPVETKTEATQGSLFTQAEAGTTAGQLSLFGTMPTAAAEAAPAAEEASGGRFAGLMSLGSGGGGLMGGFMTYLIGSTISQLLGSTIGGKTGKLVGGIGQDAAIGAGLGSIIPGVGTVVGGLAGAGIGLEQKIFGGGGNKGPNIDDTLTNSSSTFAGLKRAEAISPGIVNNAFMFGGADSPEVLTARRNLQLEQIQKNTPPGAIAVGSPAGALTKQGEDAIKNAKTYADKVAALNKYMHAIDFSYEELLEGSYGNKIASNDKAALELTLANTPLPGKGGFMSFYSSLTPTAQTGYDTYIKDTLGEQGLGAKAPGGQSLVSQANQIAAAQEKRAADLLARSRTETSASSRASDVNSADIYAKEAHTVTQAVLDQSTTDLQDSLAEATNPAQILAAYRQAISEASSEVKVDPQKAKADMATAAGQLAQENQQIAQNTLSVVNAFNSNTVDMANETIATYQKLLVQLKGAPGVAGVNARAATKASIGQGYQQQETANQGNAANAAQLAAAQAGNDQVAADQQLVTGWQNQIAVLQSSHLSASAKSQQMVTLSASLTQAKLSLLNDTLTQANTIAAAANALAGDATNNPYQQAAAAVKTAAQAVTNVQRQGSAAKPGALDTALDQLKQAKFAQQSTDYSQLQIQLDLAHSSISQQVVSLEKFAKSIKNNKALYQQVLQQILSDELSAAGSYELNVGNAILPTAYQVRRSEHALRKPHDEQGTPFHVHGNVIVTVQGAHNPRETAKQVVHMIQHGVASQVRASQRSSSLR